MDQKPCGLKWHVVYTMPKSERKVASSIEALGMESYLPLHKVIRQWSDRKKKMEVPLFPNYVFVKVDLAMRGYLYAIKEIVRFVSIEKKPVVVRENEIITIKKVLSEDRDVLCEEYFQQGLRVRIEQGQFAGLEGEIIKKSGATRLIIRVDSLMRAFSFNISARHAKPLAAVNHIEKITYALKETV